MIINWTFVMLISKADAMITKIRDERTIFVTIGKFVAVYRTGKKSVCTSKTSIFISRCSETVKEYVGCVSNASYHNISIGQSLKIYNYPALILKISIFDRGV